MIRWFDDPSETPLSQEELEQLKVDVRTRKELNEFESANIASAMQWAARSRLMKSALLSSGSLLRLHRQMFAEVWKWAGTYRGSDKSIGVPKERIPEEMKKFCDDSAYWQQHNSYDAVEIALRIHHRLVWIHPFVNGNGRHARLVTDLFLQSQKLAPFTWGAQLGRPIEEVRQIYVSGLRAADEGDLDPLRAFLRPNDV